MEFRADERCFACGKENEWGIKLSFRKEGEEVIASFIPHPNYQGYSGILHGGIISTVLDEAMFYAVYFSGEKAATAELTVRFKRPVPVSGEYLVYGKLEEKKGRLLIASARLVDKEGKVYAEARGKFLPVP